MDLDKEFVLSVSLGGAKALSQALDKGITPDHLFGDGRNAFEYLLLHRKEYGSLPTPDVILQKTGVDLPVITSETPVFWINEVISRRLFQGLREGAAKVTEKLEGRDPQAAAEVWREINRKIMRECNSVSKIESLFALGKEVLQQYDNIKAGKRGIATPWPTMDDQTMGWWPEDLVLFAGRLGTGKTWTLLVVTHAAWKDGARVMIVSTEMNKIKMAMRFFALHFRLPYDDVRRGKLGEFAEQKLRSGIASILNEQGIYIVGGDFDFSIDNVGTAIEDSECQLAAVDGAYLIKNTGKDRHERVSNTFDDLKRIAKRGKLTTVANTQFNRSAKKGESSTITADNVGITDVAGWNSDIMYGIHQSDEMRTDAKMEIVSMKIREGKPGNIRIRWDLDRMDFSEVDESGMDVSSSSGGAVSPSGSFEPREPGADDDVAPTAVQNDPDKLDDLPF